jgi:hypothetical protein
MPIVAFDLEQASMLSLISLVWLSYFYLILSSDTAVLVDYLDAEEHRHVDY